MFKWLFKQQEGFYFGGEELSGPELQKTLMRIVYITSNQLSGSILEHIPESKLLSKSSDVKPFLMETLAFQLGELLYVFSENFNVNKGGIDKTVSLCGDEIQNIPYPGGWKWSKNESEVFKAKGVSYYLSMKQHFSESESLVDTYSPAIFSVMLTESILNVYGVQLDDTENLQRYVLEIKLTQTTGLLFEAVKIQGFEYK